MLVAFTFCVSAQRIVVDTASTNKYLINPPEKQVKAAESVSDPSFGDRAMSIGVGILNRLKARLNLEEAAETIKEKKARILGKEEKEEKEGDG